MNKNQASVANALGQAAENARNAARRLDAETADVVREAARGVGGMAHESIVRYAGEVAQTGARRAVLLEMSQAVGLSAEQIEDAISGRWFTADED